MTRKLLIFGDKTLTHFCRDLGRQFKAAGHDVEVVDGGYGSWLVNVLGPSATWKALPASASLAFLLSPRLIEHDGVSQQIREVVSELEAARPVRTVFFANMFSDPRQPQPLTAWPDLTRRVQEANDVLYQTAARHPWFHVVDNAGLVTTLGLAQLTDVRFEASADFYFSPQGANRLARHWVRSISCLSRPPAKVLVTDLDNTLWSGVLGEDGVAGIRMNSSGRGWGHRRYQQHLLALRRNGILLAVASKNNPDEALAALGQHSDSLLRPEHFSALEIGWGPKSTALREISRKLNLGLDSFVFVDDSEVELAEVLAALPQVRTLRFPADSSEADGLIPSCVWFDTLKVTAEDVGRANDYAAQAQRAALKQRAITSDEFLQSLEVRAELSVAAIGQHGRAHQLVMKTNQFNLTGQRLTEEEVSLRLSSDRWLTVIVSVEDRFSNSGITGVVFVDKSQSPEWHVENLLISCRVLGRTVEHAIMHWLADRARAEGAERLCFHYQDTGRNKVAYEFLETSGLAVLDGGRTWEVSLRDPDPKLSRSFVTVTEVGLAVDSSASDRAVTRP